MLQIGSLITLLLWKKNDSSYLCLYLGMLVFPVSEHFYVVLEQFITAQLFLLLFFILFFYMHWIFTTFETTETEKGK